jgi:hypothetical protein
VSRLVIAFLVGASIGCSGSARRTSRPSAVETGGAGGDRDGGGGGTAAGGEHGADASVASDRGALPPPPQPLDAAVVSEDAAPPVTDAAGLAGDSPQPPGGVFENSLGMRFLSVPGLTVMVSVWETRVKDYDAFAAAAGAPRPLPDDPGFVESDPTLPKSMMSRRLGEMFSSWLTEKERKDGTIGALDEYRLPTDQEFEVYYRAGSTTQYPWGGSFPPPDHFANYEVSKDGFEYTAPVGSFPANRFGLHDVAGNLWEWLADRGSCGANQPFLVRGVGWNGGGQSYLATGFHYCFAADFGHHNTGFRVVLERTPPRAHAHPLE